MSELVKANADITAIETLLKDYNKSESAIVINLRVFQRLMEYYPQHFKHKGKAIIFKDETHVYFHNGLEEDIRIKKASKEIEKKPF